VDPELQMINLNFTNFKLEAHEIWYIYGREPSPGVISILGAQAKSEPKYILDRFQNGKNISGMLTGLRLVLENSSILPTMREILVEVAREVYGPYFSNDSKIPIAMRMGVDYATRQQMVAKAFDKWEGKQQFEILKRCNRSAMVLPDRMCQSLAINVSKAVGTKGGVYVGKDLLYRQEYEVQLRGFVL